MSARGEIQDALARSGNRLAIMRAKKQSQKSHEYLREMGRAQGLSYALNVIDQHPEETET